MTARIKHVNTSLSCPNDDAGDDVIDGQLSSTCCRSLGSAFDNAVRPITDSYRKSSWALHDLQSTINEILLHLTNSSSSSCSDIYQLSSSSTVNAAKTFTGDLFSFNVVESGIDCCDGIWIVDQRPLCCWLLHHPVTDYFVFVTAVAAGCETLKKSEPTDVIQVEPRFELGFTNYSGVVDRSSGKQPCIVTVQSKVGGTDVGCIPFLCGDVAANAVTVKAMAQPVHDKLPFELPTDTDSRYFYLDYTCREGLVRLRSTVDADCYLAIVDVKVNAVDKEEVAATTDKRLLLQRIGRDSIEKDQHPEVEFELKRPPTPK